MSCVYKKQCNLCGGFSIVGYNIFITTIISQVYSGPQTVIEKTVVHTHYKPSHKHHGSAYIGG